MTTTEKENRGKQIRYILLAIILVSFYWNTCRNQHAEGPSLTTSTDKVKRIGEMTSIGNFTYRVDDIHFYRTLGNEFTRSQADGIYLVVRLSVMNDDKIEHMLDNNMFNLTDQNGTQYAYSIEGATSLELSGQHTLFLKRLNPNIMTHGFLVFEVPNTETDYYLNLSGGLLNGESGSIELID